MSAFAQVRRLLEWRFLLAVAISILALMSVATAHEVRPAYLQIDQVGKNRFSVLWRTPLLSGARLPVVLQFSDGIRQVARRSERQLSDSVVERSLVESTGGLPGQRITFVGLQATITDVLVRIKLADGTVSTTLVQPSRPWIELQAREGPFQVARVFVFSGIEHILLGIDHLLFVLALLLLVQSWRRLVGTITAFTLAHSITLAAATLGLVHVPSKPVEAAIALSIVFVAAEIVHGRGGRPGLTERWPWVVAFVFGLLHGFGFAGALSEVGLPERAIPTALLFFNIGVEVGQLVFVAAVATVLALTRRARMLLPGWSWRLAPYSIGVIAMYWTIDRVNSFWT